MDIISTKYQKMDKIQRKYWEPQCTEWSLSKLQGIQMSVDASFIMREDIGHRST